MKYFKPTNWAIEHKTPIYILTIMITILGAIAYIGLPKEQMPDIVIPTIVVQTIHPGTSPTDIENVVTRPIEKQLKSVAGIKKVTSQSMADVSVVVVEFKTDVSPVTAKQRVNDAVDKAKADLPDDLLRDPDVAEIDFSEFPIMSISISGDLDPARLKLYAEEMQDKIETFREITRVDIIGAPEREFQVNLDLFKMAASGLSFDDVERALRSENVNVSGGEFVTGATRRNVRLVASLKSADDIASLLITTSTGAKVYLRDVGEVKDAFKEQLNFARMNGKSVISLSVIKKSGQNLIEAADKISAYINTFREERLPKGVTIDITNDMSQETRTTLSDLINTVIIGFILVTIILMFFLGLRDSVFVALSVPLSSLLAILVMPTIGFTFNMIVMFSFIMALGIIVDDAIVVIENTHRLYTKENIEIKEAAKLAAGEVFVPVLTGTMTTLAPFFPLLFFPGIVGKFMYFLPVILILTLTASLVVAYIINPMLAAEFMGKKLKINHPRRRHYMAATFVGLGILLHIGGVPGIANFFIMLAILGYTEKYFLTPVLIKRFQEKVQPAMMRAYRKTLQVALHGKNPYKVFFGTGLLLIVVFIFFGLFPPKIQFFSEGQPDYIYAYIKMPIGTDAVVTDSVTRVVEKRISNVFKNDRHLVKSIISNVGLGAGDPYNPDRTVQPHKGKVTVSFVDFEERIGVSTKKYMDDIRKAVRNMPGVEILVDVPQGGPPTGKPINIEISGDDLDSLLSIEKQLRSAITRNGVGGIEKLKSDIQLKKPEIVLEIDRARANTYGLSAGQIGMALRAAVFGREATKIRDDKDEYPIQIRLNEYYRENLETVLNMPISFRDMNSGQFKQVPISAVVTVKYGTTYESIIRKNQKRTITLSSSVLLGYNANDINKQIAAIVPTLDLPKDYAINLTGEAEDMQEASNFLMMAFIIAIGLVIVILVTQFNSLSKTFIIISQVVFSTIGVFLGFMIFRLNFSIVLTGIGVIALIGIVVRNGIVLVDFIDLFHNDEGGSLRKAIIHGGATRFNPVALTALSAILGMVPLAIGLNVNFATFFTELNPHMYIGGFTADFWGPLAWAIIFGLIFATFLTLVVVPCMYYMQYAYTVTQKRKKDLKFRREAKKYGTHWV